jgi:peptide chain release factor 1
LFPAFSQPPPADDAAASVAHAKLIRDLEPIAEAWKEYTKLCKVSNNLYSPIDIPQSNAHHNPLQAIEESHQLLSDPDASLRSMASEEIDYLNSELSALLTKTLPNLLLQPTPTSSLSAILDLKAGVGGDESSLFVEQISRMYIRYANTQGWKCEILSKTAGSGLGGLKEITIKVLGEGAFGRLKSERGVHRVQRVPETESAGRVHTSTIAVVVGVGGNS